MADPKPKAPKIPPGYKDEAEFITEARERFQQAVDFDKENREQGQEDLRFLAGEQWTPEAINARAGRPCLSLNTLPPFIAQVVGDIRINKPAIRVRPAEDADKDLADIREGLIRAIERDNDAQGVYSNTGENQVACGIGNFRISLRYASDQTFDREIGIDAIPDPFAVVWDPMSTERTGKDADYVFVQNDVSRKAFEAQFKDTVPDELEIPQTDPQGWFTADTVKLTEYWIKKETPVTLAQLEGGEVVELANVPEGTTPVKTRKATRKSACMYLISGKQVLAGPYELPIDRLPIIKARGWEIVVGAKRIRWGLVRFAKDAARLKNYWRSVQAEKLALSPRQQWLIHEGQVGDQEEFRNAATNGDTVLTWNGSTPPVHIPPTPMETALIQAADQNAQDIKDVTGIHDASLGARSNETSGKAILAREKQGDVATFIYHDNLHAAIGEGGRVIEQLIDVSYDTARTIRVVGEDETVKVQRVNDPNDPKSKDLNRGRYDVIVEAGPSYSTKRVEAAESMMQFVQAVPGAAQFVGDLIAQSQDWPMADKIAERLKKTLPPGFAEESDEEKTPEEQQAKAQSVQQAQQQQQMAEQAAMLQMGEQKAKTQKAQADAVKAEADAVKATIEVGATDAIQLLGEMFGPEAASAFIQNLAARKFNPPDETGGQGGQIAA